MKKTAVMVLLFMSLAAPAIRAEFKLEGIEGFPLSYLSDDARNKLEENGFVVTPGYDDEMFEIYEQCRERNQPVFVTTDSVLHTSHIFFDYLLRILEIERLYGAAEALTDRMIAASIAQWEEAGNSEIRDLARLNIGFFSVAKKIFSPTYEAGFNLGQIIDEEIGRIDKHEGIMFRSLLEYVKDPDPFRTPYAFEDYSQYVPRGHYTRNEEFKKYFKAMMWYGRMDFKLKPGESEQEIDDGRMMTLQAILMADAMIRDEEALRLWTKVYEPTAFFVGESDDLAVEDYIKLIKEAFPSGGSVDKYANTLDLARFMDAAEKLEGPSIISNLAYADKGDIAASNKGFRFMGQRFIPDSYMFQELVYGKTGLIYLGNEKPFTMEIIPNVGPVRAFPRGLDVMAVLGSKRALEILEEGGDTDYEHYYEQLDKLRAQFSGLSESEWKQNLYFRWMHALLPLLEEKDDKYPDFMRGNAWLDKELQTSQGSWAELRHDTILYAKQSYTAGVTSAGPSYPQLTRGYVEPYPEVYERLGDMMFALGDMMNDLELEVQGVQEMIDDFRKLLSDLKGISEKELKGEEISDGEYAVIWKTGARLSSLKDFPPDIMSRITSGEVDEKMDVIADVHTDGNTKQVLEAGVGRPFNIYVTIEDSFGKRTCRGAVFSYYEFKWPMDDRMTDEMWQNMRSKREPQPGWVSSFTAD